MKKDGEAGGGLWCSFGFGSSPGGGYSSSVTKPARLRHSEMVRQRELETATRFRVHYTAIRPSVDAKSFGRLSNAHGIIGFEGFLFKFKFPFPRLNLHLNASITRDSNGQAVHDTG
jgi:hypothetical protein